MVVGLGVAVGLDAMTAVVRAGAAPPQQQADPQAGPGPAPPARRRLRQYEHDETPDEQHGGRCPGGDRLLGTDDPERTADPRGHTQRRASSGAPCRPRRPLPPGTAGVVRRPRRFNPHGLSPVVIALHYPPHSRAHLTNGGTP